jgi:hypothetical protein
MNYKNYEPMNQTASLSGPLTPPPLRDKGEVDVQMGRMADRMKELHGALGVLEDRLSAVMCPPAKEDGARPAEHTNTPLGTYIGTIAQDLQHAVDRAHAIINRLGL